MAWAGSTRKQRLPPDWRARRRIVLKRDNYQCQWIREDTGTLCLAPANQVDHRVQGADDDHPDALQSLCEHHHQVKSSREGGRAAGQAARARKNAARKRHPGIID